MATKFTLLDVDYEGTKIILHGVNENGKYVKVEDEYQPYIYVLPKSRSGLIKRLKEIRFVTKTEEVQKKIGLEKTKLLKVFVDEPQNTSKLRDIVKHNKNVKNVFEYNIPFYKRYLNDKKFYPMDTLEYDERSKKLKKSESHHLTPSLKILAFDIEVIDNEIIMISLADNKGLRKVLTYKKTKHKYAEVLSSEKEVLQRFEEIINDRDPDVIVGFNSDAFDFEIIRERADANKLDLKINRDKSSLRSVRRAHVSATKIKGRLHIDLFNFIYSILQPQLQAEAMTLADVSEELLGRTKEEMSLEDMIDAWKKNKIDDVVSYCLTDSTLTLELAEMILPQIFELSKVSGQLPFDTSRSTFGLLVEWYLVRRANELGIICPNNPHWLEIQKRREIRPYQGGYVKEPKVGMHEGLVVFDFRSLYPSIIVTYNISPETLNTGKPAYKVPGSKNYFEKEQGFVSHVVKNLIESRLKIKSGMKNHKQGSEKWKQLNEQQIAVKTLANASYGYLGFSGARWYSRECAEAAAAFGRETVKRTIKEAEKFGFEVIYADTDSLFVKLKKNNKSITSASTLFLSRVNKSLPGILELDIQGIYKRGLFVPQKLGSYTAKKRYALLDEKGNITIRGFEAVRKDWCDLARDLQREILRLVLSKKEKEAITEVKKVVAKIKTRKIDLKDIAVRTMLGKELSEYKAVGPHVAVARKLEAEGHEVRAGMVLSYIITKGKGSISQRAKPTDRVSIKDYDIEYYLNNQIISAALRVLGVFGYDEKDFVKLP